MEELTQLTPLICQLFEALGLVVNQKKSMLSPQQMLEFLGFQVDTVNLQLIFPAEKLRKIQQLAQHLFHQPKVSVRDLVRFMGKASAATRAIWQAPLHFRALQFLMNSVSLSLESHSVETEDVSKKFSTNLTFTKEVMDDLNCRDVPTVVGPDQYSTLLLTHRPPLKMHGCSQFHLRQHPQRIK